MSARDEEIARWLLKVEDDLGMARAGMNLPTPIVEPSAFHCQQAVEKMMKTVLVRHGIAPERTHDLNRLLPPVIAQAPTLEPLLRPLLRLTDWAVSPRYPDLTYDMPIEAEEVRAVLPLLDELLTAVRKAILPVAASEDPPA